MRQLSVALNFCESAVRYCTKLFYGGIMAIDVYLQIDGIKGESADDKHRDWIECSSVHWGISQPKSATSR